MKKFLSITIECKEDFVIKSTPVLDMVKEIVNGNEFEKIIIEEDVQLNNKETKKK